MPPAEAPSTTTTPTLLQQAAVQAKPNFSPMPREGFVRMLALAQSGNPDMQLAEITRALQTVVYGDPDGELAAGELETRLAEYTTQLNDRGDKIVNIQGELDAVRAEMATVTARLNDADRLLSDKAAIITAKQGEVDALRADLDLANAAITPFQTLNAEQASLLNDRDSQILTLQGQVTNLLEQAKAAAAAAAAEQSAKVTPPKGPRAAPAPSTT